MESPREKLGGGKTFGGGKHPVITGSRLFARTVLVSCVFGGLLVLETPSRTVLLRPDLDLVSLDLGLETQVYLL